MLEWVITVGDDRTQKCHRPRAKWTLCTEGGTMSVVTIAEAWPAAGQPFTVAELDRMPDDGRRYAFAVSIDPADLTRGLRR
jgi:hypothetical protein